MCLLQLLGGLVLFIAVLILPAPLKKVGKVDLIYVSYYVSLEANAECDNWGLSLMPIGELCAIKRNIFGLYPQVPGTQPLGISWVIGVYFIVHKESLLSPLEFMLEVTQGDLRSEWSWAESRGQKSLDMGFREKSRSRMTQGSLVWYHIPRQGPRKRSRVGGKWMRSGQACSPSEDAHGLGLRRVICDLGLQFLRVTVVPGVNSDAVEKLWFKCSHFSLVQHNDLTFVYVAKWSPW